MTVPAAIQGDYTDLKFIKSRKVCQITIEIPIEAGASFVAAFGTPSPATGVPVAVARLDPNAKPEKKGGKLAQRAGILCNEGGFWRWLSESGRSFVVNSSEAAGEYVRNNCGVSTRAELDHNDDAARRFLNLEAEYKAWLTVPA